MAVGEQSIFFYFSLIEYGTLITKSGIPMVLFTSFLLQLEVTTI